MVVRLFDRHLKTELQEALDNARVVNLVGPRQTGKTTLVRELLGSGHFVSFDDENVLAAVEADPQGQIQALVVAGKGEPIIIDEVQRSRRIALTIKRIVDADRRMGQFVLTGSSNVFVSAEIMDSLAGRVQTLKMLPLSSAEIDEVGPCRILDWARENGKAEGLPALPEMPRMEVIDRIIRGGYPEIRALPVRSRQRRYREYINSIVERDVADVVKIRKTDSMRRLIDQLAVRTGSELNMTDLGGKIGLTRQVVGEYLDILESLSLISRLPAWTSGEAGRDIRNPKCHLVDTGIAAALRGLTEDDFALGKDLTPLGSLFETFVYTELAKSLPLQRHEWRLYHWRDSKGREVDIVAENGKRIVGFEVKASATVSAGDFKNLRTFESGPAANWDFLGLLIYMGDQVLVFADNLLAIPVSVFSAFQAP